MHVELTQIFLCYSDNMSDEEAESQSSRAQNEGGPGTQSGMAKMVKENFAMLTENMKTLSQAVQTLRTDVSQLKRKAPSSDNDSVQPSTSKQSRSESENNNGRSRMNLFLDQRQTKSSDTQTRDIASDVSNEEDIDALMEEHKSEDDSDEEKDNTLDDLEKFFGSQDETGPEVTERTAKVTDKALRGEKTKEDEEKLQALRKKHKRPENIKNMQIPRIEDFMWRQLKRETRTYDFVQQKALEGYNSILSPLVKALDLFKSKSQQDKAIEYVTDAYKIIGLIVKATNNARVEKIKRELHTDYRSICKSENTSATCLLGENVNEKIKKLKEGSKGSLTATTGSHFLGRRGGTKTFRKYRGASHTYHNYHNNNNNN